jgi:TRAP transporter 4TM/12TM fusion protein
VRERGLRQFVSLVPVLTALLSGAIAVFHLYAAGIAPFTALVQRPVHLAAMAALGFLGQGAASLRRASPARGPLWIGAVSNGVRWVLIAGAVWGCGYLVLQHEALVHRVGTSTPVDIVAGVITVVVVLELARRTSGWGMVSVAMLAIGYAFAGPYLPGMLAHRGYGLVRLVEHLYLGTEGIWGVPLGVSADFVYLFILFGAVLDVAGGGELLIALASKVAGQTRGGPAKTAAVASALMGSLSGSAVANVVTTGSFTIPLMKRNGFRPFFAAAIEAAASTGGQLMPPIMGAGAFILAAWTNIAYVRVAVAAAVPAILFYVALFIAIHLRAHKMGLSGSSSATSTGTVASRLHLLAPLILIVILLAMGRSPMRAAFWGVAAAAIAAMASRATRFSPTQVREALTKGATGTVQVAAACAAAGIVVGVASLTGIGLRMSELIVRLSGGHLPLALVLTGLGSIVLGMGLPTTAAYVVLAALGAPALTQLGVPTLAAHLFIFYFGAISNVTPPVSLAAFAAAGIAEAPLMRTAFTAMALAGAGFLVPFMFIYHPGLLLADTPVGIGIAVIGGVLAVTALAAAVVGYWGRQLSWWQRGLLVVGAIALTAAKPLVQIAGLAVGLAAIPWQTTSVGTNTSR